MNISSSGPIAIRFYVKHHWGRGKAACTFGGDLFRTLVAMAIYSPHIKGYNGEMVSPLFSTVFGSFCFILAGSEDIHKISDK